MTRDDIIRMAREAEQYAETFCNGIGDTEQHHWFDAYNERFAALVAAAERDACEDVCTPYINSTNAAVALTALNILDAIRARGGDA